MCAPAEGFQGRSREPSGLPFWRPTFRRAWTDLIQSNCIVCSSCCCRRPLDPAGPEQTHQPGDCCHREGARAIIINVALSRTRPLQRSPNNGKPRKQIREKRLASEQTWSPAKEPSPREERCCLGGAGGQASPAEAERWPTGCWTVIQLVRDRLDGLFFFFSQLHTCNRLPVSGAYLCRTSRGGAGLCLRALENLNQPRETTRPGGLLLAGWRNHLASTCLPRKQLAWAIETARLAADGDRFNRTG